MLATRTSNVSQPFRLADGRVSEDRDVFVLITSPIEATQLNEKIIRHGPKVQNYSQFCVDVPQFNIFLFINDSINFSLQ